MLAVELTRRDLERALDEARRLGLPSWVSERIEAVAGLMHGSPGEGMRRIGREAVARALGDPRLWRDAVEDARTALLRRGENPYTVLERLAEAAEAASQPFMAAYLAGGPRIRLLPVDLCRAVGSRLSSARAAVLLSGSMPPREVLEKLLCLRPRVVEAGARGRPPGLEVIVAEELSSRLRDRGPGMYRLYARYIAVLASLAPRVVLAVHPSYEFMREIVALLPGLLPPGVSMLAETKGMSLDEARKAALGSPRLLLNVVAGGKLAEGVELKQGGRSLVSAVFVAGVPYPRPDDYLRDLESRAGPGLLDSLAAVRVLQAVGRARRGPSDRALVVLGDKRFLWRRLSRLLPGLLAAAHVAHGLAEFAEKARAALAELGLG